MSNRSCLAVCLALGLAGSALAQEALAIKGGKVIPIGGEPIEEGIVLIRDGKIEAVGKGLTIPTDARVIDAKGKVVLPGFIEAHSSRGMDQVNETNPNVPFLSVLDSIDPSQDSFEEARRNGVTTIAVVPGHGTMLGGQAAIVKTAGTYLDDLLVKRDMGMKLSLRPTGDRSRMSHLAALRKELDLARDALKEEVAKTRENKEGDSSGGNKAAGDELQPRPRRGGQGTGGPPAAPTSVDPALAKEALKKLLRGEQLAFIYCDLAMDVPQALKLTKDYGLKTVLVLGPDCHKAAKLVADSKLPVILEPTLVYWESDPRTGEEKKIILPKVYQAAGVPLTFQVTGFASGNLFRSPGLPATLGTNYLWFQAATAVKHGHAPTDALAAITVRPAKILGIDKLVGTLEPGKDADVVILTGEPLAVGTWVDQTLIRGKVVYDRAKDEKLKSLLKADAK